MYDEFRLTPPLPDLQVSLTQITPLMGAIGQSGFVEAALRFAHGLTDADFLSLYCQGDRDTPLLMGTTSTLGQRRAARAAEGYRRHWAQDRDAALLLGAEGEGDFFTHHEAADLQSFLYRRDCYDLPGITSRVSLVRRRPGFGLVVSLYSATEFGTFPITARDGLIATMSALMVAVERHVGLMVKESEAHDQDVQARLALNHPNLTKREREVAAMTIKGRTAAEIAAILGVAETTVITHRKKAYKRMNVASMRELLTRV
ncbi:helix-turn-helix domain-containing protein [Thalassobius sp. Cn5-15]|uniref:helix-turn-helix transcriptional regulator n=1 Tax=Thalassobius sp. Cn5-15 TaxID=2917763 RepID=UPI001EF204D2|nr:helix-turn-helix domain-containing protein [Thalassobius sp. Cn5-15]MCG7493088.1 helix-turn-helix domain-containing protein [Thalassobius sp. Cn5-15]